MKQFIFGAVSGAVICGIAIFIMLPSQQLSKQISNSNSTNVLAETQSQDNASFITSGKQVAIPVKNKATVPATLDTTDKPKERTLSSVRTQSEILVLDAKTANRSDLNYNTASVAEIVPTISSDLGILGDNTDEFLRSSRFDDVLLALEKEGEESFNVQENVGSVIHDSLGEINNIYVRQHLNCNDQICLASFEFDSKEDFILFFESVLKQSIKPMAGTVEFINDGNLDVARVLFNHKTAAFILM